MKKFLLAIAIVLLASTAHAATSWYVDNSATGSNNGTSWANAWISFSNIQWSAIKPGDIVYISGGAISKTYTTKLTIVKSGVSGNPITIKAGQDVGHNGTVVIDGGGGTSSMVDFGSQQYVTLDGQYNGQRHIVVQNNTLSADANLLSGSGTATSEPTGIRIAYVEVKDSGSGIRFIYHKGTEIDHCYIHNISYEVGIDLDGSLANYSGDMSQYNLYDQGALIHDNIIQVNNQGVNSGVGPDAIQGTHGLTIYNNSILGLTGPMYGGQHQDGVQVGGSFYKVYNNYFYGLANSDLESDWGRTVEGFTIVWNNHFGQSSSQSNSHGIEMQAYATCSRLQEFRIYNNTWVDFTGFIAIRVLFNSSSTTIKNMEIKNNIIYNTGTPVQLGNANYTMGTDVIVDHNNINAGPHGGTSVQYKGTTYTPTNPLIGTPSFVSYKEYSNSNDLHLTSASTAAIGKGLDLSTLFNAFNAPIADKDSVPRPQGSPWDVGAYQYAATTRPLPPVLHQPQ